MVKTWRFRELDYAAIASSQTIEITEVILLGTRPRGRSSRFPSGDRIPADDVGFPLPTGDRYCNSPASRMGPGSSAAATARSCAAPARFRGPVRPVLA